MVITFSMDENRKLEAIIVKVIREYEQAVKKHGPFRSPHEGYSVIAEELDELWDEVRMLKNFDDRRPGLKKEAIQIAAMVIRYVYDLS